jgi:hypothetical protein
LDGNEYRKTEEEIEELKKMRGNSFDKKEK